MLSAYPQDVIVFLSNSTLKGREKCGIFRECYAMLHSSHFGGATERNVVMLKKKIFFFCGWQAKNIYIYLLQIHIISNFTIIFCNTAAIGYFSFLLN